MAMYILAWELKADVWYVFNKIINVCLYIYFLFKIILKYLF